MFEFHGWINIQCVEDDEKQTDLTILRQDNLCNEIRDKINQIEWSNGIFKIFRGVNGEDHLVIDGCANHHQQNVIDLFYWIANKNSDSYGILHVIDDEKISMDIKYGVKTWRLIKDEVVENTDPILSSEINRMLNMLK